VKNSKSQITNNKQITMTKIQNRFVLLEIEIWNLFEFWCLCFGIWHYFRRSGKH
jgi:hypothetical protein